jgi:TolB-like protein
MMAEPSIAILPFVGETLAGLPMAADLTTELTRIPKSYVLRLLAASAPDVPAGKGGQEIGPRYQVSGNLRRVGGRLHLNVQLIDTTSNSPVWATQADFTPDEPGAEDRVRTQIARAIVVHVVSAEVRRPLPSPPQAGQLVLQGIDLLGGERGAAPNRDAKALFDRARMLDARFVPALLGCARTRLYEVLNSWAAKEQWPALLDEIELCLQDAANLEPYNPSVHAVRGQYLRARGKDPEAIAAFAHALSLYRLYPAALAELGRAKIEVGLASEAVPHIEDAIRLSPADPGLFAWYFWAGMADTHLGRYASAIDWLLKSRQAGRGFDITLFYLAIAYAGAGDMQQARAYLNEYRAIRPNFSVSGLSKVFFPGRSPVVAQQRARIVALLCALGAPGCAVAKTGLE